MSTGVIEEKGVVRTVGAGVVKVEIGRPYCREKEGKCGMCSWGADGGMILEVRTDLDLKEGQKVILQIEQPPILHAAFFVFVLPVICLLVGMSVGNALFGPWGALLGVAMAVGSFFLMFLYDWYLRKTNKAVVRIFPDSEAQ